MGGIPFKAIGIHFHKRHESNFIWFQSQFSRSSESAFRGLDAPYLAVFGICVNDGVEGYFMVKFFAYGLAQIFHFGGELMWFGD